jgi:hypothetical protein
MTDSTPSPAPRRRLTRTTKAVIALVVVIVWTSLASEWTSKGCDFVPEAYSNVIFHGTPDDNEGCVDDAFGNSYTDDYEG